MEHFKGPSVSQMLQTIGQALLAKEYKQEDGTAVFNQGGVKVTLTNPEDILKSGLVADIQAKRFQGGKPVTLELGDLTGGNYRLKVGREAVEGKIGDVLYGQQVEALYDIIVTGWNPEERLDDRCFQYINDGR